MTAGLNFSLNISLFSTGLMVLLNKCEYWSKKKLWQCWKIKFGRQIILSQIKLVRERGKTYFPIVYIETYLYPHTSPRESVGWWKQYATHNQPTVEASSSQIIGLSSNFFVWQNWWIRSRCKRLLHFCVCMWRKWA